MRCRWGGVSPWTSQRTLSPASAAHTHKIQQKCVTLFEELIAVKARSFRLLPAARTNDYSLCTDVVHMTS